MSQPTPLIETLSTALRQQFLEQYGIPPDELADARPPGTPKP